MCFCAQEQPLLYSVAMQQVRHRWMASPVPNRQMYECRKIVMVRLLPSLGGDKGYTAGITTYHTTTTVTNSGKHRGKGVFRKP